VAERSEAGASGEPRSTASGGGAGEAEAERRRNGHLRQLVDEMLASVRAAAGRELWSEEERRQYEGELAEIMKRVRFEAVWKGSTTGGRRGDGRVAADGTS
jgi:hypothetical protein